MNSGTTRRDRILIVGTGALATLFAARLGQAGYIVGMLGTWQSALDALAREGARLIDEDGREQRVAVAASGNARAHAGASYALVLVKAWQTDYAARQLAQCLDEGGLALTLQNGLGNREILSSALGSERVAIGSTTTGATLLGPGLARAGGEGKISIEAHARLGPLQAALASAGFTVDVLADARSLIWSKLVVNSAINPLTAILRVPNGELLVRPAARSLMHRLAEETAAVAHAEKIKLLSPDPVQMVEQVARSTASNRSSMFQDVLRGAPTEIDAISGAVSKLGIQHGIPTPLNEACWQLVQAIAQVSDRPAGNAA